MSAALAAPLPLRDGLEGQEPGAAAQPARPLAGPAPRILIVTPEFPPQPGGIGTHCCEMAMHWGRVADVTVLCPAAAGARRDLGPTVRLVDLPRSRGRSVRLLRAARTIRRLVAAGRFDLVYVAHWRTSGIAFRLATTGIRRRPRYAQAIHGGEVLYLLSGRHRVHRKLFGWTVAGADRLVALGENQARLLDRLGVGRERVFVSPEGVDVASFHVDEASQLPMELAMRHGLENERVLLTVARLVPHKGHDMVIRALPRILASVPNAAYLVVGSGAGEPALRELAGRVGVAERVRFAGYVPDGELPSYYHLCDVFVMASREADGDTEGFGIAFAEAAACGKPAVGGRTGGIVEVVQEGRTGLLVDPTSPDEIAEATVRLLTDEDLARRLGEAGRRRVTQELQYRDIAAGILGACLPAGRAAP